MNKLKFTLMYQEALRRLQDAETLSEASALSEGTDSAYLLQLLALEILLKIAFEFALGKPGRGHAYEKLFATLPQDLQTRLLSLAGERVGPSTLTVNHQSVLKAWGQNFVDLRYPWEKYEGLTEKHYLALDETWVSEGALPENAMFRYHPEELFGLLTALRIVVSEIGQQLPST